MNVQAKETKAPADPAAMMGKLPMPPKFANRCGRAPAPQAPPGRLVPAVLQVRLRRRRGRPHHRA